MPLKFRIGVAIHEIVGYLIFIGLPATILLVGSGTFVWWYFGLELARVITSWVMIGYGIALILSVFLNILTFTWGESELHHGSTGQ